MAVIRDDLDIVLTRCAPPPRRLCQLGSIISSYDVLTTLFGPPEHAQPGLGNTAEWTLHTPAGSAIIRTSLTANSVERHPTNPAQWSICAADLRVLPWIYKTVTGSTAAFPFGARPTTRDCTRSALVSAYGDYLDVHGRARADWLGQLPRDSNPYRDNWTAPRYLRHFALQVAGVLHDHEWAHATPAERLAWAGMSRPKQAIGAHTSWRDVRWRYVPTPTEDYPDGGHPDLAALLHARAADTAWLRDKIIRPAAAGAVRNRKIALADEHSATLTALAKTPVAESASQGDRR